MKKILLVSLLALLLFAYALSYGANYKMICDDLDQTGGKESSTNYKLMVSAGGQPSPIGSGSSTNYKLLAGHVGATFVQRGDPNGDGLINLADCAHLVNYLFIDGPAPEPLEAGDANCDDTINGADVAYLINYLFVDGPTPCDP